MVVDVNYLLNLDTTRVQNKMSDIDNSALTKDIQKRLTELFSVHDNQALHVSELFFEIRNNIDYDVEKLIYDRATCSPDETVAVKANEIRDEFFRVLKYQ